MGISSLCCRAFYLSSQICSSYCDFHDEPGNICPAKIPVEHMPNMDAPALGVYAGYRGASAETVEQSVTQILEQAVKGIEGLETFHSSSSVGRAQLDLQFEQGVDLDQAQLQVQNAVNGVLGRLPEETQQGGVNVYKSGYDQFALLSLYDESGQSTITELSDYLMVHVEPRLSRIEGMGRSSCMVLAMPCGSGSIPTS